MRLGVVTGHAFGRAAMLGAMSRPDGVELVLTVGLSRERENATSGYVDVADVADRYGARYIETTDGTLRSLRDTIDEVSLDVLFVVGWSRLVHDDVLELFPPDAGRYAVGMHPTLLPHGRGRAPIPWTILHGLERTGLSCFLLVAEADAGDLVGQVSFPVPPDCTSTQLFEVFEPLHGALGRHVVDSLATFGRLPRSPQDERASTSWPKRTPADSEICDGMSYDEIDRLIRASTPPYPPPFVRSSGEAVTVLSVATDTDERGPDTHDVHLVQSGLHLRCAAEGS